MKLTGGVLHTHSWRPLAALTDKEVELLSAVRKKLSGPSEDVIESERTDEEAG